MRRYPDFRRRAQIDEVQSHYASAWLGYLSGANGSDTTNRTHIVGATTQRLDLHVLKIALSILSARHSILIAGVQTRGEQVWIRRGTSCEMTLELCDASLCSREERMEMAKVLLEERVWRPFEPSEPLSRAVVVDLGDGGFVIAIVVHHFVCDDISLSILRREFMFLYQSIAAGMRGSPLPAVELDYWDYLAAMQEWFASSPYRERLAYWVDKLTSYRSPPITAPAELVASAWTRLPFTIVPDLADRLRAITTSCKMTLFGILLAAHHALVSERLHQESSLISSVTLGRDLPLLRNTFGRLIDRTFYRADGLSQSDDFLTISKVKTSVREATHFSFVPAELISEALLQNEIVLCASVFNYRTGMTIARANNIDQPWRWFHLPRPARTSRLGTTVYEYWMELSDGGTAGLQGIMRARSETAAELAGKYTEILERFSRLRLDLSDNRAGAL